MSPEPGQRTLLLDSSFRPIRVLSWRRAMVLDLLDRADVLEYYDAYVHTVSDAFPIPAVLKLKRFVHLRSVRVALSRKNVFARDGHACQYCGAEGTTRRLTMDHVLPRSRGGSTSWENLVTACEPCNRRKGNRTPHEAGMPLRTPPRKPSALPAGRRGISLGVPPEEWQAYLVA